MATLSNFLTLTGSLCQIPLQDVWAPLAPSAANGKWAQGSSEGLALKAKFHQCSPFSVDKAVPGVANHLCAAASAVGGYYEAEADRAFGKLVFGGIEPHPGPQTAKETISCVCLNCGSARGAWTALNDFLKPASAQTDVLLLQEAAFTDNEYASFQRALAKVGHVSFQVPGKATPGRWGSLEARHGVMTIVKREIPHELLGSSTVDQSSLFQAVLVRVGAWVFINSYTPPKRGKDTKLESSPRPHAETPSRIRGKTLGLGW